MNDVMVYTTPTCPYCKMAKDYLDSQRVDYVERNVQEDEGARKEMVDITGQFGVPVIISENQSVVGYDVEKINNILGLPK